VKGHLLYLLGGLEHEWIIFHFIYGIYIYMILPIDELHHFPRWLKQKKPVMDLVSLSETGVYHLVIFMSFFPYFGAYVCNGD
jgi:hypothetical protein